jgi:hypothetical protein
MSKLDWLPILIIIIIIALLTVIGSILHSSIKEDMWFKEHCKPIRVYQTGTIMTDKGEVTIPVVTNQRWNLCDDGSVRNIFR